MTEGQRSSERAPFDGWVEITSDGQRRLGSGRDLSAGGIGVCVAHAAPAAGTLVTSEFALPGISLPLALEGRVVWGDGDAGRLGIRFDGIDAGVAELLENFVAGRL